MCSIMVGLYPHPISVPGLLVKLSDGVLKKRTSIRESGDRADTKVMKRSG